MDHAHKFGVIQNNEDLKIVYENSVYHRIWKAINWSRTLLESYCWVNIKMVKLLDLIEDFKLIVTHVLVSYCIQITTLTLDNIFGLYIVTLEMNFLSTSEPNGVILFDD